MIRIIISEQWRKISMTEFDLILLKHIRSLYGWDKIEDGFISVTRAA